MTQSQPQFKVGDRVWSHYSYKWGTIESIDNTERDRYYRGTGLAKDRMDDTTWYTVRNDDGSTDYLDDAHGNWEMARIVPPHIAKRYGYGDDPNPFHVVKHIAPMTGACWFKVVDNADTQHGDFYDDFEDAKARADRLNGAR